MATRPTNVPLSALQAALLQNSSHPQLQAGGSALNPQAGMATSNHAAQQQLQQAASLEALLKLERLRQSQQVQAQQHQAACLAISQLAQQGSPHCLSSHLNQQQADSAKPPAKSSSGLPAGALSGVTPANNANAILQHLWEQQQRAVLLAMLQQQQQKNLQQLLSTIALSSPAAKQGPIIPGAAAGSPASGAASPVSGIQSPFGGSLSPPSGSRSPSAPSPSHSGPSSPRASATPVQSMAAFATPTQASCSRPPLPPSIGKEGSVSQHAAAGRFRSVQRLASRASPKGVHEFDFNWDQSPTTSPRNGLEAGKPQGEEDKEDAEGCVDLPSEEEFESHLFGVQLSFM